jgi:hypothetical protein
MALLIAVKRFMRVVAAAAAGEAGAAAAEEEEAEEAEREEAAAAASADSGGCDGGGDGSEEARRASEKDERRRRSAMSVGFGANARRYGQRCGSGPSAKRFPSDLCAVSAWVRDRLGSPGPDEYLSADAHQLL